jgi:hypothetical protein
MTTATGRASGAVNNWSRNDAGPEEGALNNEHVVVDHPLARHGGFGKQRPYQFATTIMRWSFRRIATQSLPPPSGTARSSSHISSLRDELTHK